ncbi:MAG: GH1 family beta-glucosidase [Litorivicinus sp.]
MIDQKLAADSPLRDPGFEFGVATSSFQIEGATGVGDRRPSIWDTFCREPGRILDGSNGDIACDHYHRFEDDLDMLAELGFRHYRLSLAWPRLMDINGRPNTKGLDFYRRLLEACHERQIVPNVTLYHWDLPADMRGGWLNRDTAYRFADYASAVAYRLGDLIPRIATLNEPWCSSILSYDIGAHAPGHANRSEALTAAHHLLLASGLGIQAMRAERSNASLGLVLNFESLVAATEDDQRARDLAHAERNRFWLDRLTQREPSSDLMAQGQVPERPGDAKIMAEPLDWLGVNYYTESQVMRADNRRGYDTVTKPGIEKTHIGWDIAPQGLTDLLVEFDRDYDLPPIYITENGAACDDSVNATGGVNDDQRRRYFRDHLAAVESAMENGVDIQGYYAWSLMDNFEWAFGYSQRFGLVHVDYDTQLRTPKQSALDWQRFLASR